jgi:hypothetical protein
VEERNPNRQGRGIEIRGVAATPGTTLAVPVPGQVVPGTPTPTPGAIPTYQTFGRLSLTLLPPLGSLPTDPTALLQLLVQVMGETRDLIASEIQQGIVNYWEILVQAGVSGSPLTFSPPLFAVSLTNDGPNTIQYAIPLGPSTIWANLESTEVINIAFPTAVIQTLGYRYTSTVGGSGLLRIVGSY